MVPQDVDASLILAMAVVIDEIHDEENPDAENSGEALPDMLEDAKGLPMPRAPAAMCLGEELGKALRKCEMIGKWWEKLEKVVAKVVWKRTDMVIDRFSLGV